MKTQKLMMVMGSVLITLTLMAAIRAGFAGPQPATIGTGASSTTQGVSLVAAVSA
ncbi:MAG: hypothetical protein KGI40_07290 [Xanthomonadaceae bacterium]|nr:hypothetical protein [Xanthomonadaceae bacterium]MDE2178596.1 hypothetical protein [Xanthomonadaceae bacterium]MDE2246150.1 hypothetical protein [Xanthomonadaceae bacterium]